jgi:cytochrome c biogenesis protein CcmG/thiol:disulfide interchange protein DsbE
MKSGDPQRDVLPSALIDKPAPAFALPVLHDPEMIVHSDDLRGAPYLLNVWGSWCAACREEHPVLTRFAESKRVRVIGYNWKDDPTDALHWLEQLGNPFMVVLSDVEGRTAIDWGVTAAPETFLVDGSGIVRWKYSGAMTQRVVDEKLIPALRRSRRPRAVPAAPCTRRPEPMRWLLALLLMLPLAALAQQPLHDPQPLQFRDDAEERRFHDLAAQLRCVQCQNQSLADSNAQIAQDLRREVLQLMQQGTTTQIKQFLVDRYGEFVLYQPPLQPGTWLLWGGPLLVLGAGALVVLGIVRRRGRTVGAAPPARPMKETNGEPLAADAGRAGRRADGSAGAVATAPHGRRGFVVGVLALGVAGACLYLLVGDRGRRRYNRRRRQPPCAMACRPCRTHWSATRSGPMAGPARPFAGRTGQRRSRGGCLREGRRIGPEDPGVLVEAAQARAQADAGKQFDDTAMAWLQQARAQAPDAERASWLLGIALRQRGRTPRPRMCGAACCHGWSRAPRRRCRRRSPSRARPPARRRCWRCGATGAAAGARAAAGAEERPSGPPAQVFVLARAVGGRRCRWPHASCPGRIPGHGRAGRR